MILSPIRLSVLRKIEEYCEEFGVSADKLGRLAVGCPKTVPRLRRGKEIYLGRVEKLLDYIDIQRATHPAA